MTRGGSSIGLMGGVGLFELFVFFCAIIEGVSWERHVDEPRHRSGDGELLGLGTMMLLPRVMLTKEVRLYRTKEEESSGERISNLRMPDRDRHQDQHCAAICCHCTRHVLLCGTEFRTAPHTACSLGRFPHLSSKHIQT